MTTVTDIDWSKKPEGATHWYTQNDGSEFVGFYKLDGDIWMYWSDSGLWKLVVMNSPMFSAKPLPTLRETFVIDSRDVEAIASDMLSGVKFYDEKGSTKYFWDKDGFEFVQKETSGLELHSQITNFDLEYYRKTLAPIDHKQEWIEAALIASGVTGSEEATERFGRIYDAGLACKPNGN